jgi:hypothetical protein
LGDEPAAPRDNVRVSNPDARPEEVVCGGDETRGPEILTPREVPLGGPRAMRVRRTLPQRGRSLIGAWCFVDHYGPDEVATSGGMSVAPHPHTGLQTVSWLFQGEITHRDSAGNVGQVLPGEVNLMTAGQGISHSEISTPQTTTLHGAQLWVALPAGDRFTDPGFEHYAPTEIAGDGWRARVFLGSLLGDTSPVATFTPLLGAELVLDAGARLELDVESAYEHGVLVDHGSVEVAGISTSYAELAFVPCGSDSISLVAGADGARLLLLGGPPFGEEIVMWWNFVGRTHEEIVAFREEWQAQIAPSGDLVADSQQVAPGRFGIVVDDHLPPIPAPGLPNARLRSRS